MQGWPHHALQQYFQVTDDDIRRFFPNCSVHQEEHQRPCFFTNAWFFQLAKFLYETLNAKAARRGMASMDVQGLASLFSEGKAASCPFNAQLIQESCEVVFKALEFVRAILPMRERTQGQPLFLAALEELRRISGDPDCRAFFSSSSVSCAKVVELGVGVKTRVCLPSLSESYSLNSSRGLYGGLWGIL